jgi:hypothetical protein
MAQAVKRTLTLLLIAFLLFYLLTQPRDFAEVLRSVGSTLEAAGERIIDFFNALTD